MKSLFSASLIFFILIQLILVERSISEVLFPTESDFARLLNGVNTIFVQFFDPSLSDFKKFAPFWEEISSIYSKDNVKFLSIDGTNSEVLVNEFKVKSYPTFLFFPRGTVTSQVYPGSVTKDAIIEWLNMKLGVIRRFRPELEDGKVKKLYSTNFDDNVFGDGNIHALVEFFAPWCGHCKSLAPKYDLVAHAFKHEKNVTIAKVDCTAEPELAQRFNIEGYPTIKMFPASGASEVGILYQNDHTVDAIVSFVNEHARTKRKADGSLLPSAGRLKSFNAILKEAGTRGNGTPTGNGVIDDSTISALTSAMALLTKDVYVEYAKIYIAIAEKVVVKGFDYIELEVKRLNVLINNNATLAYSKLHNFMIKRNILGSFQTYLLNNKNEK